MGDASNRQLSQILVTSVVLCGAALVLAGAWYYAREREGVEGAISAELATIADAKADQIANWRRERIGDGGVLSSAPVAALARRVLSQGSGAGDRAELRDILERFIAGFHYAGAAVVDPKGAVQVDVGREHHDAARYRDFQLAVPNGGTVLLSDLYLDAGSGRPWMLLTVLVPGAGALVLDIDPETFLYPYVRSWPTNSRSGETILARREGKSLVYLSEGRQARGVPAWRDGTWSRSVPETSLHNHWTDDRGVAAMGLVQQIPDSNWYLIAKTDMTEANEPLKRLGWGMALVIVLIAATNATGAADLAEPADADLSRSRGLVPANHQRYAGVSVDDLARYERMLYQPAV
jgi:hypothetical protein